MSLSTEVKRKAIHLLPVVYMALYWAIPRWFSVWIFLLLLIVVTTAEFLRLRRPELNAKMLGWFGGVHRPEEVLRPSAIFWSLAGIWLTVLIFDDKHIVLAALGFLTFGDAAAALGGRRWGKHPWPSNPKKTYEGSACFAVVSASWALLFVHWPVAITAAVLAAWAEARVWKWDDNFWIPLTGALALSICNLALGRHG